jgi:hypothetical protein
MSMKRRRRREHKRTLRLFLVSRTFAKASQASMPSVLPKNLTSSTASFSFNALICGSMSSAVVSFRPLPSRENSLSVDIVIVTKERNSQDVFRAIVSGGGQRCGASWLFGENVLVPLGGVFAQGEVGCDAAIPARIRARR